MLSLHVPSPSQTHEPRENIGTPRSKDADLDLDVEEHPFSSLANFEQQDTIGLLAVSSAKLIREQAQESSVVFTW